MAGISSPLQLFGDFGFSGGEDVAPNPLQDNQTCINWYAEVNKQNAKEILGLLGCPGLVQLVAAPGGGVPASGGIDVYTGVLMHFDGSNGSTSFIDVGGHTFTGVGSGTAAALSTTTEQFGPSSVKFSGNGSQGSAGYIQCANLPFGAWGPTNDFTVECWINYTTKGSICGFDGSMGWVLSINSSGKLDWYSSPTATHYNGGSDLRGAGWTAVAAVRHNGTTKLYVNGASVVSFADTGNYSLSIGFTIGGDALGEPSGYLDELRLSNIARYTANYTPSGPFGGVSTSWPMASTVLNLAVRGAWELPDGKTALTVIGNTCYLVTLATPATPTSFATLALTSVGTLITTVGPVHIRDNNIGGHAVIVDGPYGYLYTIASRAFAQITDPAFLGADTVAFIDGWWIFNQPGTQTFYTNFPQYGTGFNASFFALKDSSADNLVAVHENKEQLWLIGDKTTEIWYDAGGPYFGFQRLVGTPLQVGCKAKHSVARFSSEGQDGLMWFGRSERGENVIVRTRGFAADAVSTPAFSAEVAQYPITADAIGYTYQEDTHEFYVLTFPTADVTWCYDAQSGLLHKRLSYDPYLQKFHRHRSNCFMNFQGMRIVGDYQCGSLFQLTRNVQTDAGWPLRAIKRSPHIWDKGQRGRTFMASVQADFKPGVGTASGLGSNPQAKLRISRDGGATYGQQWAAPIGQIGQYRNRTMWRRLAFGRDNVIELEVIDPVPRDLIGVTLKAFSSA